MLLCVLHRVYYRHEENDSFRAKKILALCLGMCQERHLSFCQLQQGCQHWLHDGFLWQTWRRQSVILGLNVVPMRQICLILY